MMKKQQSTDKCKCIRDKKRTLNGVVGQRKCKIENLDNFFVNFNTSTFGDFFSIPSLCSVTHFFERPTTESGRHFHLWYGRPLIPLITNLWLKV